MKDSEKGNLPRLRSEAYRGLAVGHWIFNIQGRKQGWLTELFFVRFQLISAHAFHRYKIASPCICLMPDHIHLLLMGYDEDHSDQRLAIQFLRRQLKAFLHPFEFQKTPFDHLLRKEERERDAFQKLAGYIRENPVRAGLVAEEAWRCWPYECAVVPGYPELDTASEDFWDRFWKIYYKILKSSV